MTTQDTMKLALEALRKAMQGNLDFDEALASYEALKAAPVQQGEPVAWMYWQSCLNDDGTQTAPWVQRFSNTKPPESVINKDITPLYAGAASAAQPELPQKERPDFIAGYDAGMADAKRMALAQQGSLTGMLSPTHTTRSKSTQ